jgi:glutathione S-transferase
MRARLAVQAAGVTVELREILLKDKPDLFLNTSASGTVPALKAGDVILDESLDIMIWALEQNDPEGWLTVSDDGWELITRNDGPFKAALDRTKYATRYDGVDPMEERQKAATFLIDLNNRLARDGWLFGGQPSICDFAILPFVRQFANIDRAWFDAQDWPHLLAWLERFLASDSFAAIMVKHPVWADGQTPLHFPATGAF